MAIDPDFWTSRRVLLTGHTGFKGAWLSLWLQSLGADVTGLAAGPATDPSMCRLARIGEHMQELAVDVRDAAAVAQAVRQARPEVVLHLAAQPMVRRSLREPALTYAVNVMGTVNVLDAVRLGGERVRAIVVVTSDKCYENPPGGARRFVEGDALGGRDPYSSSKACAELVAAAYRRSYFESPDGPRLATARAGNVIGGGDWGEDRLLADAVRAVESDGTLLVRNPDAVRPWQHVLNPLGGYLMLAQALWRSGSAPGSESADAARAWNLGPPERDAETVGAVVARLRELWGGALRWEVDGSSEHPPEAGHLALDSTLAETELGWRPPLDLDGGLRLLVEWHRALGAGRDMREVSLAQIGGWTAR